MEYEYGLSMGKFMMPIVDDLPDQEPSGKTALPLSLT
jgi:hypothetical protein